MTWLTVYCIGIAVGITLDNVFWYALARIKENDKENYK
jgi:predicted DNA-binding ribbon-helix-helix protein